MGAFLVEGYLAAGTAQRLGEFRTAAARATRDMARDGIRVRYLSGVYLPADQMCFSLFQAADLAHVSQACDRAGIPCDRITEALLGQPASDAAPPPEEGQTDEKPA